MLFVQKNQMYGWKFDLKSKIVAKKIKKLLDKANITTGILTDGDLKRLNRKFENFQKLKIKTVMKKNPVSIDKNTLAAQALSIMNTKKITSLCVHKGNQKNKTVGIIHIHNILKANIS